MKGYSVADGYMGFVDGSYQLFASEADYREWMEDQENVKQFIFEKDIIEQGNPAEQLLESAASYFPSKKYGRIEIFKPSHISRWGKWCRKIDIDRRNCSCHGI